MNKSLNKMINRIIFILSYLLFLTLFNPLQAQTLIKTHTYYGTSSKNAAKQRLGVSLANKPNGVIHRSRVKQDYPDLQRPSSLADCEAPISESTHDGYIMLLHREIDPFNHQYWCLIYDQNKSLIRTIDLCAEGGQNNCEITDIRYDNRQVIWNFSCITNASRLNSLCNQLFCYDLNEKRLLWKSAYLTSRDVFTLDDHYIYSGYGFTDEPDFVYLIDRQSGQIITQCPIESAPCYMELTDEGLFVEDYRENGYLFKISDSNATQVTGETVRLREGPSTDAPIYSANGNGATYPLKGDIFESLGTKGDFNVIRFNDKQLYISKRFSRINMVRQNLTTELQSAGVRAWINKNEGNFANFEVFNMGQFTNAVELMPDESNDLSTGYTYRVYIDEKAIASGVFLSPCGEYGVVLFILAADGRLFALDMLEATADDGTPLQAIEIPMGNFSSITLESNQKNGSWSVWAIDINDHRKKVSVSNLDI